MTHRTVITIAAIALACALACQKKTAEAPPAQQSTPSQTTQATPPVPAPTGPSPVEGNWKIAKYYMPDMIVMTEAEAKTWVGRTLRFSRSEAVSGEVRCVNPTYTEIPLARDTLLGMDAGYPSGVLMRLADYDPLFLVNIHCDGKAMNALGRLIIKIDDDHLLAPWDAVYFELERTTAP